MSKQKLYAVFAGDERLWNETATSEAEAMRLSQERINTRYAPQNRITVTRAERVYDLLFPRD